MKAIIPSGGRGTRMQPITFSANKHFIPVANKPLIYYPIETVAEVGIKEIGITYNPGWLELVKQYLGDGSQWGVKFSYILQEKPAGLANIVEVSEEFVENDKFVFHLGDNIFAGGIKNGIEYFEREKPDGMIFRLHHPENSRMGVPYFDENNRLVKYVEKPKDPPHDYAVPGVYFLTPQCFEAFKGKERIQASERGEYEILEVFQWLVNHKRRVDVIDYEGKWLDPGKFGDWIESNQYLLDTNLVTDVKSDLNESVLLEGRVSIGKECEIINSEIRGPVAIGDHVSISNSYIGPFSSISSNCHIENSHIENSVLMEGVKIKSIKRPIDRSLIGTQAEVTDEKHIIDKLELFIGEKSQIKF